MPLKVVSVDIVKHEFRGWVEDKQTSPPSAFGVFKSSSAAPHDSLRKKLAFAW